MAVGPHRVSHTGSSEAVEDYVRSVLPQHWDEQSYLSLGDAQEMEEIFAPEPEEELLEDDAEFAARDQESLSEYDQNPMGFTAGLRFKGE